MEQLFKVPHDQCNTNTMVTKTEFRGERPENQTKKTKPNIYKIGIPQLVLKDEQAVEAGPQTGER